jgi:hypothetical protein
MSNTPEPATPEQYAQRLTDSQQRDATQAGTQNNPTPPPTPYTAPRVPYSQRTANQNAYPTNGFGIAALILGIIAIVIGILPLIGLILSFIPTICAIIFGILGIRRAGPEHIGFTPSLIGLILGGLTLLLYFTGYGLWW